MLEKRLVLAHGCASVTAKDELIIDTLASKTRFHEKTINGLVMLLMG